MKKRDPDVNRVSSFFNTGVREGKQEETREEFRI